MPTPCLISPPYNTIRLPRVNIKTYIYNFQAPSRAIICHAVILRLISLKLYTQKQRFSKKVITKLEIKLLNLLHKDILHTVVKTSKSKSHGLINGSTVRFSSALAFIISPVIQRMVAKS